MADHRHRKKRVSLFRQSKSLQRLVSACVLIFVLCMAGTVGYMVIEDWRFFDAFYMTIISMTTVGYGETRDLGDIGRAFTIVLLVSSVGVMGYAVSTLAGFVIEGELNRVIRGRIMDRRIADLSNHLILCGLGNTGRSVAGELLKTRTPFVIVEKKEIGPEWDQVPALQLDATHDESLIAAGIERARGLLATLPEDKDNVFIALSARSLNPDMRIVVRLMEESNAEKLKKAGADAVVLANAIGGLRMASVMIRPEVVSFLDQMLRASDPTLRMDQISIGETSPLCGMSLGEADVGGKTGLLVVSLQRRDGSQHFNPPATTVLRTGDVLIAIGTVEQMITARQLSTGEA